jgi:hypothetical protein
MQVAKLSFLYMVEKIRLQRQAYRIELNRYVRLSPKGAASSLAQWQ